MLNAIFHGRQNRSRSPPEAFKDGLATFDELIR